jgi:hypothetical protein
MMICPFCREEIIDGAIKCKHCGSMIASAQEKSGKTEPLPGDIPAQIEALDISPGLKSKLHLVHKNFLRSSILAPKYKREEKGWRGKTFNYTMFNWLAFFFPPIYYLIKGMWRKALVILGMFIGILIIISIITPTKYQYIPGEYTPPEYQLLYICLLIPAQLAGLWAYYDIYRKEILKQDFWW